MRENRNVPFRDWNIRVSRNHNGQLHICAVDICDILKRDELLENGAIARVCPTALKISFRKNGREQWGFRPIDMRRLLQLVRKETIIPRDLLDELEVWGNKLLELEAGELHAVPQDDIVMHFEEGFPVTFRRVGDKLMVNATQITMHFGKIPSEWLRIASTDMLRREMAGNGHTGKYESQVFTTREYEAVAFDVEHTCVNVTTGISSAGQVQSINLQSIRRSVTYIQDTVVSHFDVVSIQSSITYSPASRNFIRNGYGTVVDSQ